MILRKLTEEIITTLLATKMVAGMHRWLCQVVLLPLMEPLTRNVKHMCDRGSSSLDSNSRTPSNVKRRIDVLVMVAYGPQKRLIVVGFLQEHLSRSQHWIDWQLVVLEDSCNRSEELIFIAVDWPFVTPHQRLRPQTGTNGRLRLQIVLGKSSLTQCKAA
jgi:hypothetical protein